MKQRLWVSPAPADAIVMRAVLPKKAPLVGSDALHFVGHRARRCCHKGATVVTNTMIRTNSWSSGAAPPRGGLAGAVWEEVDR